jgi:chromosome segregation ATPase
MGLFSGKQSKKEKDAEIARLQQELSDNNRKLDNAEAYAQSLEQQNADVQQRGAIRVSQLDNEMVGWKNRFQDLEEEKQTLLEDLKGLRTKLARLDLTTFTPVNGDILASDLQSVVEAQRHELRSLEETLQEREISLANSIQQLVRLTEERENIRDQLRRQGEDFESKSQRLGELEQKLNEKERILEQQNALFAQRQRELAEVKRRLNRQHELTAQKEEKIQKISCEAAEVEKALRVQHEEAKSEVAAVQKAMRQSQERAQREITEVHKAMRQSQVQANRELSLALVSHEEQLNRERKDFSDKLQTQLTAINEKESRIAELEREVQETAESVNTTRLALNQTRNELTIERRKVQQASQESADKSRQLEYVQQQCASLNDKLVVTSLWLFQNLYQ